MKTFQFSFFFFWSIVFLLITIIGFGPSFLLRPWFYETTLPLFLVVHGIIMLLWYSGYFYQNLMIAKGKLINHKNFGIYMFLLAIIMFIANFNVVINLSTEIMTKQPSYYDEIRTIENSGGFVIGNLYFTVTSSILIIIAYLKRFKPNAHKRAIFGASFLLLSPAFDRFVRPFGLPEIFQFVGSYFIPVTLLVYDIVKNRKVHPMTILVLVLTFITVPLLLFIINNNMHVALIEFLG